MQRPKGWLGGGEAAGLGWVCGGVVGEELAQRQGVSFDVCLWGGVHALEGCRIGRESRMCEHGGPAVKQSCRDCLPEQWGGLSCPLLGQEAEEGASFLAPPASCFDPQDDEATAASTGELWVDPLLVAASVVQCRPCISAMALSGLALPGERGDDGGVDCDLAPPPQRQTICDDFDTAVIEGSDIGYVQVRYPGVGGHPCPGLTTNASCCSFEWPSAAAQ